MSIINDALKKAQAKLEERGKKAELKDVTKMEPSDKAAPPAAKPKPQPSMKKKKAWHRTVSFLVVLFLIIAGVLTASVFYLWERSHKTSSETGVVQRSYRPAPLSSHKSAPGKLELNGVSYIDSRRVALINNEIYEVGDTVGKYTINSIEHDLVLLQDAEGNITTLKVR